MKKPYNAPRTLAMMPLVEQTLLTDSGPKSNKPSPGIKPARAHWDDEDDYDEDEDSDKDF